MGIVQKFRRSYDISRPVKKYNNFCKKLKFCDGKEITVKVNEKFAKEFIVNYTIPPQYFESIDEVEQTDEEIELIETREFYPYYKGTCGGDTHMIYVFQAKKKGIYNIKFSSFTLVVTAK